MQQVSEFFPWFIAVLAGMNVLLWFWLFVDSRSQKAHLSDFLLNIVRLLPHQSDLAHNVSMDERINIFIHDIREATEGIKNREVAGKLRDRLLTKDESRLYLKTHRFEVRYSIARTFIEIFPLLGIVGTVIAIWAGMNSPGINEADKISQVVQNFGHSVVSTAIGLGAAVVFMVINALFEPGFERLLGYADTTREMVAHAKKKLDMAAAAGAETPP